MTSSTSSTYSAWYDSGTDSIVSFPSSDSDRPTANGMKSNNIINYNNNNLTRSRRFGNVNRVTEIDGPVIAGPGPVASLRNPLLPLEDDANTADGKGESRRLHHEVMRALVREVDHFTAISLWQVAILGVMAGAFVTFGAVLSAFLSTGVEATGPQRLLTSLGFIGGFFWVILSGSALFTAVNVSIPVYLMVRGFDVGACRTGRAFQVWFLVLLGNFAGTVIVAVVFHAGRVITPEIHDRLAVIVRAKVDPFDDGARGWFAAVASGIAGNWMVGLAGYNAMTAPTVTGKWFGIAFPIIAFVSLNALHCIASMAYFHVTLITRTDDLPDLGISWADAWGKSIIPSIVGNVVGAVVGVALPFTLALWYRRPLHPHRRERLRHK